MADPTGGAYREQTSQTPTSPTADESVSKQERRRRAQRDPQRAKPREIKNIHQGFGPFFMMRQPTIAVSVGDDSDILISLLPKINREASHNRHENNPISKSLPEILRDGAGATRPEGKRPRPSRKAAWGSIGHGHTPVGSCDASSSLFLSCKCVISFDSSQMMFFKQRLRLPMRKTIPSRAGFSNAGSSVWVKLRRQPRAACRSAAYEELSKDGRPSQIR